MEPIIVDNKTLLPPVFVPSISSFETQLDPTAALQLQYALREPVSLVSAYDVRRLGSEFEKLCGKFRETSILLLDSGGYEHSHAFRYAESRAPTWKFDDFESICKLGLHDYVFSFDYFWRDEKYDDESADNFELRLTGEIFHGHKFVAANRLIPVVHLHTRKDDGVRLSEKQILSLVSRIASECKSPFIAIPERELGDGLMRKFELTKKICDLLAKTSKVGLHVLGCGNPLSFAFLTVAGARMADGLEWYRTFVADNFHLHHFQQEPVFLNASEGTLNPTAELILNEQLPYRVKVATLNLLSLQTFSSQLSPRIKNRTVHELVQKSYGKKAGAQLQGLEV